MSRVFDYLLYLFAWGSGLILVGAFAVFMGFLLSQGLPALDSSLLFGRTGMVDALLLQRVVIDGLLPALVGTLLLIFLALAAAVPFGLGAGIYLAEYAGKSSKALFSLVFDLLAGVPSIVIGLFGFSLTVFLHKRFTFITPCLLISALALALLILPYLIRSTQTALEELPATLRLTAAALGADQATTIRLVLLPQAAAGILSGIVLAIGRAAEDTAVIMLTGVVVSAGIPRSLFNSFEALPFYIYNAASQFSNQQELQRGFGAALILLILCGLLFTLAWLLRKKVTARLLYHH
ncbi:MAG: ABC transporter permease subunit [Deltaproteobacteria bacterium]|nr:ABC transporter permease subunit [Deltaproteobacteria bacterium]